MRVDALETVFVDEFPNLLWVQVHTDEGLIGLGETFLVPARSKLMFMNILRPICWVKTHWKSNVTAIA
jgi:galactonate dehydratase